MAQAPSSDGSAKVPYRRPLEWHEPNFWDEENLYQEMERQFDICHTCRRCFSLCKAFPTLFDEIDESESLELDSVPRKAYWKVVDQCYLCDLCFMTKCPYTPPHEFNMDFPHLMLRAKAVRFKGEKAPLRDRVLTSTDAVGRLAGIPVVAQTVNRVNRISAARQVLEKVAGVHRSALLPEFHSNTLRKQMSRHEPADVDVKPTEETTGKIALFATCYGNRNLPSMGRDLVKVFEHNGIPVRLTPQERCCGMPKLELGDLESIDKLKSFNIPRLAKLVDEGWDLTAAIPSCVLMFKQELPLIYPEDAAVQKVKEAFFDPFEYLALRHKAKLLKTEFVASLGKVAYHVPCHQRVQNIGLKTREILSLIPDTEVQVIERCSGHDGTYAVKREFHENSMKIGRPVFRKIEESGATCYGSDCPMAADQLHNGLGDNKPAPLHPLSMLCKAYGL